MVHKVKGKEVEKLREDEKKQEDFDRARDETMEKINDYGKRKEVLDNADTTYLTNTQHDVRLLLLSTILHLDYYILVDCKKVFFQQSDVTARDNIFEELRPFNLGYRLCKWVLIPTAHSSLCHAYVPEYLIHYFLL